LVPPLPAAPWTYKLEETLHAMLYWKGIIHTTAYTSKTAIYVKLTNNKRISMENFLLSLSSQTLGRYSV
jgi:hypothetical protein